MTQGVVTPNIVAAISGLSPASAGGSVLTMPAMAAAALAMMRAEMRLMPATSTTAGIIVTSLTRSFNPANWFYYKMSFTEVCLIVGSFAWFFMFFLVFVRVLPAFSIAEIKETLPMPKRKGGHA